MSPDLNITGIVCTLIALLAAANVETVPAADADIHPLKVDIEWLPERVDPATFFFVKITLRTKYNHITAKLPDMSDSFEGFRLAGEYERRDKHPDGTYSIYRRLRLSPEPGAARFRMAPIAVEWHANESAETKIPTGYQLVPAVYFDRRPPPDAGTAEMGGLRNLPFFYQRSPWPAAAVAAGLLSLLAIAAAVRKKLLANANASPAPRNQAYNELRNLLQSRDAGSLHGKDFFFELSMILRRFTHRACKTGAPCQTTPEYLDAIRNDPRFTTTWTDAVAAFMKFADTQKYAGYEPDSYAEDRAAETVRHFINNAFLEESENVELR